VDVASDFAPLVGTLVVLDVTVSPVRQSCWGVDPPGISPLAYVDMPQSQLATFKGVKDVTHDLTVSPVHPV
jgi:hypothetical protein